MRFAEEVSDSVHRLFQVLAPLFPGNANRDRSDEPNRGRRKQKGGAVEEQARGNPDRAGHGPCQQGAQDQGHLLAGGDPAVGGAQLIVSDQARDQ